MAPVCSEFVDIMTNPFAATIDQLTAMVMVAYALSVVVFRYG